MKLTLRYWHGGVFCLGAVLVFTHAFITRFPHSSGPALPRRSFPTETDNTEDANDFYATVIHRDSWGTPKKRVVPENPSDEWKDFVVKSNTKYLCNLNAGVDVPNLASDKTDYTKIDQDYETEPWDNRAQFNLIGDEVGQLGLGTLTSWAGFSYLSKEGDRDGKPSGDAEWKNMFNPGDGGIMCVYNRKSLNPGSREDVRQFSDFVFLLWDHLVTSDAQRKGLNKVIRYQVGEATQDIINEATGNVAKDQARWPGFDFFPNQDEFKALLGTPNGVGVAYLLWTHKQQLGVKTITQIKIFTKKEPGDNGDEGWFMVFYIAPPPEGEGEGTK